MGELNRKNNLGNINVTLAHGLEFAGRTFSCPLCPSRLDIRLSSRQKPYCVCNSCGIQIFFRGKIGIARLRQFIKAGKSISGTELFAGSASDAFHLLEQLKADRQQLIEKQGFIFRDKDLGNAIRAIDKEIEKMQRVLGEMAGNSENAEKT